MRVNNENYWPKAREFMTPVEINSSFAELVTFGRMASTCTAISKGFP